MSFEFWIAFVATSIILLTIPGPTVLLVVTYALGRGKSSAWATVPGVALGGFHRHDRFVVWGGRYPGRFRSRIYGAEADRRSVPSVAGHQIVAIKPGPGAVVGNHQSRTRAVNVLARLCGHRP